MPAASTRDEEKWRKAKEIAAEQGRKGDYAYVMGIYKKMEPDYFKKAGPTLFVGEAKQLKQKGKGIIVGFTRRGYTKFRFPGGGVRYIKRKPTHKLGMVQAPPEKKTRIKKKEEPRGPGRMPQVEHLKPITARLKPTKVDMSKLDPEEVKRGTRHEMEHTHNKDAARMIAIHHLKEDPNYYKKLKKIHVEKSLVRSPGMLKK